MAEGPGKRLLQDHHVLPPPVGTSIDGRPKWADPGDYWLDLLYDVGVHGAATGLLAGTLGRSTHLIPWEEVARAKDETVALGLRQVSDRAWLMSAWRLAVVSGLLAASARAVSTLVTEQPPELVRPPSLPAWAQPLSYALLNRLGQSLLSDGLAGVDELPLLLAIDAVTQALLGRGDTGVPPVDDLLHAALTTGLIHGSHHASRQAYLAGYRLFGWLQSEAPWRRGRPGYRPLPFPLRSLQGYLYHDPMNWVRTRDEAAPYQGRYTPRNPWMLSATAAAQILAEGTGKHVLRRLHVLPTPAGGEDGRPRWATTGDHARDLAYDAAVHGLSTGC